MGYISKKVAAYGQFVLVFLNAGPFEDDTQGDCSKTVLSYIRSPGENSTKIKVHFCENIYTVFP